MKLLLKCIPTTMLIGIWLYVHVRLDKTG